MPSGKKGTISEAEKRCREFTCPRCSAKPEAPCVSASGRKYSASHSERFNKATEAGRLPLEGSFYAW